MVADKQPHYRAYLLRLWRVNHNGLRTWRATLEHPHTGERLSFATLERLFAFLEDQDGKSAGPEAPPALTV